ncbi:hypothetical protein [Clostridium sp. Marseille-P2415]|uniref:hypothetical protein n=1 Tax=Clostridium sp. Marseille-P2415 TaxID=1805471 RepID=UPI0009887947|nr:hypothetical protein [Clostridium sp. Marseille-P2415]
MFQYDYPQFEKKRLLRVEMLDKLRDYPKNFIDLSFQGFGDGVVSGCQITWDDGRLTISPGMIYRKGSLYFMEQPYVLECKAEDRVRYLKVQFLAEVREAGKIVGNTRILLEDKKPDPACEIELCRFRLQEGARLRDSHENLEDYSTEYDTINLVHQPYAAAGGSTLNPQIVRQFSKEMMRSRPSDPLDASFSMTALSSHGLVTADCLREYLSARQGEDYENKGNAGIYRGLLETLKNQRNGETRRGLSSQGKRSVMLL